jgi:uncharacterized membrane protein
MDQTFVRYEEITRSRRSWPWWRLLLTGLSALALALSIYLGWHYLVGGSVIGCGGGSSCDQVLGSRWSSVAGVLPVSGLAAGVYLAILVASLFIGPATAAPDRRLAWGAMLILAGAAAGSAVWFTIVQTWIIGAFCPYCMATHIAGLLLAAFIIWKAPIQFDNGLIDVALTNPAPAPNYRAASPYRPNAATGVAIATPIRDVSPASQRALMGRLPLIGLALAAILAACQIGITPPAVYRNGESQEKLPAIDSHSVPLVGSPDARYIVTVLFDYKCPHCQRMHFMLDEAIRRYGGKLAFALCPAPLNSRCNPYIPQDVDEFRDSCELAKIGLAVWVAKREAFAAFEGWMYSLESGDRWRPRSLESARAKAIELVGQSKFDAAQADPWIEKYVQTSIQIYGDTIPNDPHGSALPKLVFGSRWVTPELYDANDLISILQASLAVPVPGPT